MDDEEIKTECNNLSDEDKNKLSFVLGLDTLNHYS